MSHFHRRDFLRSALYATAASGAFGQSEWLSFKHNAGTVACVPTSGIEFTAAYDAAGGGLPDGACPPWNSIDTAAPEDASNIDGALAIATSEFAENIAYSQSLTSTPNPFVVEFRAKFDQVLGGVPGLRLFAADLRRLVDP